MASSKGCQLENKTLDQCDSLKLNEKEKGCETDSEDLKKIGKVETTIENKVETTIENKLELDAMEIGIKNNLGNGQQAETLSSTQTHQRTMKITLEYDEAKNGLMDKQNIEEAFHRPTQMDDAKDSHELTTELTNGRNKEVDNQEEALKRTLNEKEKGGNKTDENGKAFDIGEYEKEIEQFLRNKIKLDYKYSKEEEFENTRDITDLKPALYTKFTDPNLLDAVDPKTDSTTSVYEFETMFEKPSVICVIEPEEENDKETEIDKNCNDTSSENEARSSFLATCNPVLEPQPKLTEVFQEIIKDSDEECDEDSILKAYLRPSFLLHRDSIAVLKLKDDSSISLLGKKNEKALKIKSKLSSKHENDQTLNTVSEDISGRVTNSLANNVSKDALEASSQNIKKHNNVDISSSLNDLSDSNCKFCSPIRPIRKKRRCPSVPTMSTFQLPESNCGDANHPVAPRRKRRLGKPNNGNDSFDLLMTSKACSYSLSDIHDLALEDVEFLSLKKQIDSESESSLPELVLHSAFRKSKISVPADVTWSTPEITDIVTEGGVITIKNMQHRASISILEASLPSLQHQRNHEQFAPEKTPTAARKRSHTFTSGDRYMHDVRDRAKIKKSSSNTVGRLIRRTFSMKNLTSEDNPPCMPNLFKRYKQRKKMSKRSKGNNLSTIHEDRDSSSNNDKSVHSFASIFMKDDDYGVDENGQTYLERCTANFEPYLSTSVLFPDLPDMKRSASSLELATDPPIVYHQFPLKSRCKKRSNSLFQMKPHMKLLNNESAYSLNAEAIKKAHEILNQKLAIKPVPPERSRSKLSLISVDLDIIALNDKNTKNTSAFNKESISKTEGNHKEVEGLTEVDDSLELHNEEKLHNHEKENKLHENASDDGIEASQSTESFSTIFSSNKSFNPVEEIVVPAVFEEDKPPKDSAPNLDILESARLDMTSASLSKIAEENKQFERKRIDSIKQHSEVLKEISEKIQRIQGHNDLHHEVLMNNTVEQFSSDVANPETDTLVTSEMMAKKSKSDFLTSLDSPTFDESFQKAADKSVLQEKDTNPQLECNVIFKNEGSLDSESAGATSRDLNESAVEHKKCERKRIDSIKHHSEALHEITEKIHGIQEYNRLHHEVLMNNFVRRFSFDFENAGMGNLNNTETKIDGEMEAKKAISDFLKTLDSPTLFESLDTSSDEPFLQAEKPRPRIDCSAEHLEDLHRHSIPLNEKVKISKKETENVFTFPYGSESDKSSKSFKVDGEKLAREYEEGTINVKLQKLTDMYTKDILHQTRKLSGEYERCAAQYVSPLDILNPDMQLNFPNVKSDEDEIWVNETTSNNNYCNLTSDEAAIKILTKLEDSYDPNDENEKLSNFSCKTETPKNVSDVNNKEDNISDSSNIISEPLEISNDGPKEEVLKQIINKNSLLFQTLYSTSMSQLQKSNVHHFPYQPNAANVVPRFLHTCDQILALSKINPESPTTTFSPLHSPIITIRHSSDEHGTKVVEVESPISMRKYYVTAVKYDDTPPASPSSFLKKTPLDLKDTFEKRKDSVEEDLQCADCVDSAVTIKDKCKTVFPNQNVIPSTDTSISSKCKTPLNNGTENNFESKSMEVINHVSNIEELNSETKVDSEISNILECQKLKIKNKSNLKVKIPNSSVIHIDVEIGESKESNPPNVKNLNNENGIICDQDIKKKIENVINEIDQSLEVDPENDAHVIDMHRNELKIKSKFEKDVIKLNSTEDQIAKIDVKENRSMSTGIQNKDPKSGNVELKQEKVNSKSQNGHDSSTPKGTFNFNSNSSLKISKENLYKKSKKKGTQSKTTHEILFDSIIKPENYDRFIQDCQTETNKLADETHVNEINSSISTKIDSNFEDGTETENENNIQMAINENSHNLSAKRSEFFLKLINENSTDIKDDCMHLPETEYCTQLAYNCNSQLEISCNNHDNNDKLETDSNIQLNSETCNELEIECNNQLKADYNDKQKTDSNNELVTEFNNHLKADYINKQETECNNQLKVNYNKQKTDSNNELETICNNLLKDDYNDIQKTDSNNGLETECENKQKADCNDKHETNCINGLTTNCISQIKSNSDTKLEPNRNNQFETDDIQLISYDNNQLNTICNAEQQNDCSNKIDREYKNQLETGSTKQLETDCNSHLGSNSSNIIEESNNLVETGRNYRSEIKSFSIVNDNFSNRSIKSIDHCGGDMKNGHGNFKSPDHVNGNMEKQNYMDEKVSEINPVERKFESNVHTDWTAEKSEFDFKDISCANIEMESYNHIKECCSIQCNCNTDDESIKILAVHEKNIPVISPPVTVRTWEERQVGEGKNNVPFRSTVIIPKWVQNGLCLKPEMFQPKDTSLGHPHIERSKEEFERTSRTRKESSIGSKKEEDQIPQQDRCVEVYPETLRQRQRNMAPSPTKVDIKNWENNSGGSDDDSKGGKKFLPSVKALRSQFENGKPSNRDVSPSPPPSISPPIRENLNNLGRTSSNSSTSSLVMSSLEASSGFSSLASSQATSELLSKSPDDEPVEPIFNQFHPVGDDMMCQPPSTIGWNPQLLLKKQYYIPEAPKMQSQGTNYINIDGYLEKLPSGRKKATFWNAWKRRYFVAKDGTLYYYQNNQTEKPNMKLPLMGGKVEIMDQHMVNIDDGDKNSRSASMLGIDDGKGHYVVVRCPTRQEAERWKKALDTHTVEDFSSQYVQPWPRPTNPSLLRDTLIIDIGSCSVRAGVLASQPTLPQLFFPSVVATNRETRNQIWGIDALMPHLRTNSSVAFPIRPSHKISKFSVDLNSISSLLQKTFKDLKVDPKNYNIQLSVPRVLNQMTQVELLKILFDKFGVKAVNLTHQSILALYAYNATSGIVVDIGERIDVVPVTDGYIVDGGVSRIPYGGFRILDHIRQFLFQRNLSLVNEVDSYIIRQALESVCYSAQHYNTEKQRCTLNTENFEKMVPLEEFFPNTPQYETFRNISLDFGRFQVTEGLFNPDAWGLDHPGLQKLVHKAIQECSMDIRKEMSRSIFLSGGLSQLPGISERLTVELDNLTPPAIHPKVHSSPYRYHAAYIGACVLAESPAFVQSKITKEEWQKQGNSTLRKWAL